MEELLKEGLHFQMFNFIVFMGILFFALKKPVRDFWIQRSQMIRVDMEESKKIQAVAAEKHAALQKRVSHLEQELRDLARSFDAEGAREKKHLMDEADKTAARLKDEAQKIAQQEIQRARETLRVESAELALQIAEKLIRDGFNDADQKKLVQNYLGGLSL